MVESSEIAGGPGRPAERDSPGRGKGINADFMLENIVCDLHWTTLHLATLCALLNKCVQPGASFTLRAWRHVLHDNGKIMQLALRYCAEIGLSNVIAGRISRFYDDYSAAKTTIDPLMKTAKNYSATELLLARQEMLKWRRLSQDAAKLLSDLEPFIRTRIASQYIEDRRKITLFLDEVARGDSKRVSAAGEISPPTLSQRRQAPRIAVLRPCQLVTSSGTAPATIENVSRGGLGVICGHKLQDREKLEVELEDGRRLKATVARRNGDKIGLQLASPLSSNDPLFR